jgi:copper chaperone CopZ
MQEEIKNDEVTIENEHKEEQEALKNLTATSSIVNKRIDFDAKTMRRVETMLAVYKMDLEEKVSNSEALSYIVKKGINSLFENDFKKKLEEL